MWGNHVEIIGFSSEWRVYVKLQFWNILSANFYNSWLKLGKKLVQASPSIFRELPLNFLQYESRISQLMGTFNTSDYR